MKLRTGFVSNSSSSSFVLVGAKVVDEGGALELAQRLGLTPNDEGDAWDALHSKYSVLHGSDDGVDDGFIYVGKMIGDGEYGLDAFEESLDSLNAYAKKLAKQAGGEAVVALGTRSC